MCVSNFSASNTVVRVRMCAHACLCSLITETDAPICQVVRCNVNVEPAEFFVFQLEVQQRGAKEL